MQHVTLKMTLKTQVSPYLASHGNGHKQNTLVLLLSLLTSNLLKLHPAMCSHIVTCIPQYHGLSWCGD